MRSSGGLLQALIEKLFDLGEGLREANIGELPEEELPEDEDPEEQDPSE